MKPTIIAITGPSCAGKDTLMRQLIREFNTGEMIERFPDVYYIVSSTTRPPRMGEDDRNYHFISNDEFIDRIIHRDMLEWTQFNGWKYGTDKHSVSNKPNAINIGIFNLQGVDTLNNRNDFNIIPIYLDVDWRERLQRSIRREHRMSLEIIRRMFSDYKDFAHSYKVLNKNHNLLRYTKNYDIDTVMQDILGQIK